MTWTHTLQCKSASQHFRYHFDSYPDSAENDTRHKIPLRRRRCGNLLCVDVSNHYVLYDYISQNIPTVHLIQEYDANYRRSTMGYPSAYPDAYMSKPAQTMWQKYHACRTPNTCKNCCDNHLHFLKVVVVALKTYRC